MVLDHEKYANATAPAGQSGYRKRLNLMTGEMSTFMSVCVCLNASILMRSLLEWNKKRANKTNGCSQNYLFVFIEIINNSLLNHNMPRITETNKPEDLSALNR